MKKLRDYQQKGVDAINAALKRDVSNMMMVLATGCGKTFTAVKAISPFKKRLWVTHTEELMEQSGSALLKELYPNVDIQTMIDTYGGLTDYIKAVKGYGMFSDLSENEIIQGIGIIKAEAFDIEADIVIASAQTLHRRLDRISPDTFDAVVADECHLFASTTFVKSLNHFQPKLLLGLTATPHRADGAQLGEIFDEIIYQYNISDAIQDGFLCELDAIQVKTELSLDEVRTTAGEFNQKDLKQTIDTPVRNKLLVDKYKQYAEGKQNIVFCVDIEHAQNVHKMFKDYGYSSDILVGDEAITSDRKAVINRFKTGQSQILVNVMIATAGFDHPNIGVVTLACPTKSLTKFIQQIGRGTRTLPGVIDQYNTPQERIAAIKASTKPHCTILDIVDTTTKHRIINTWSLDKDLPIEKRVFCTQEKKQKLIDFREKRKFEAQTKKDTRINLMELPKVKYSNSIKMKDPASEKQVVLLERLGYDTANNSYTKADANKLISDHPATEAQIKFLRWKGYDVSNGVTKAEATLAFDAIKAKESKAKEQAELNKILPIQGLD